MVTVRPDDALLVVDLQNDFCPGGALAVSEGDRVAPVINRIAAKFTFVAATQDWHPPAHVSFASSHPGKKPYELMRIRGLEQVLWPDHCVQGSRGAEFHRELDVRNLRFIIRKGTNPKMDSYSTFLENDHRTSTGLSGLFRELGVKRIFLAGLATDYCVLYSARDALEFGFKVLVIEDGCRGVDFPAGSVEKALREMHQRGIRILKSDQLQGIRRHRG